MLYSLDDKLELVLHVWVLVLLHDFLDHVDFMIEFGCALQGVHCRRVVLIDLQRAFISDAITLHALSRSLIFDGWQRLRATRYCQRYIWLLQYCLFFIIHTGILDAACRPSLAQNIIIINMNPMIWFRSWIRVAGIYACDIFDLLKK